MKHILFALCLLGAQHLMAQVELPEEGRSKTHKMGNALLFNISYAYHVPAGNLKDRFGNNMSTGLEIDYLLKSNWFVGLGGEYFFGNDVKEDPVAFLKNENGLIIGSDQAPVDYSIKKRGYFAGVFVGKLIPLNGKRSGLRLALGVGTLRHWIRVQDDSNTFTQISGEYIKGYDRLTGGFGLQQFIGYQQVVTKSGINFYAGINLGQAFTKSQRDWDFSTQKYDDTKRKDLQFGAKVAFTLPLHFEANPETIYY